MADEVKKKVLVTGAKGQLGFKIREIFQDKYDLRLTDSDDMDITDPAKVEAVLNEFKPEFIIHGAAYTRVDAAEDNEELCRKINTRGTENVAKAAQAIGATLIYISTDYVFDGTKTEPYTEADQPKPLSIYGLTKFEGEEAVKQFCEKHYILRIAWLFGELPEGHPGTNFVETMLKLAKEKESLSIVHDQVGSPTYSGDLVRVMDLIIEKSGILNPKSETNPNNQNSKPAEISKTEVVSNLPYGIYHFSGDGACSWYDFAKEIFTQTWTAIEVRPIKSEEFPQKAKRPAYSYMDKSKIQSALGITVRPWQEMLAEYIERRTPKIENE